jgi:hypothetical protein
MKNIFANRTLRILTVLACGMCAVRVIQAFNPQPDPPGFAMIGFTPASEFTRLNVSNVAIPGLNIGGTCQVQLTFTDGNGRVFKQQVTTLAPGKSATMDLGQPDLTTPTGAELAPTPRLEVLPAVQRDGACVLTSSVEVVGTASGQTSAYASHAALTLNHNETLVRDAE